MKLKFRVILFSLLTVLIFGSTTSYWLLRVTDNRVVVNQMVNFRETRPGSERVIEDKEAVKQFTYAVRFARKQPGFANVADPPYRFALGNKQYYLWVSERFEQGALMKLPNTETVYTVGKSRARNLRIILDQEYGTQNFDE